MYPMSYAESEIERRIAKLERDIRDIQKSINELRQELKLLRRKYYELHSYLWETRDRQDDSGEFNDEPRS